MWLGQIRDTNKDGTVRSPAVVKICVAIGEPGEAIQKFRTDLVGSWSALGSHHAFAIQLRIGIRHEVAKKPCVAC